MGDRRKLSKRGRVNRRSSDQSKEGTCTYGCRDDQIVVPLSLLVFAKKAHKESKADDDGGDKARHKRNGDDLGASAGRHIVGIEQGRRSEVGRRQGGERVCQLRVLRRKGLRGSRSVGHYGDDDGDGGSGSREAIGETLGGGSRSRSRSRSRESRGREEAPSLAAKALKTFSNTRHDLHGMDGGVQSSLGLGCRNVAGDGAESRLATHYSVFVIPPATAVLRGRSRRVRIRVAREETPTGRHGTPQILQPNSPPLAQDERNTPPSASLPARCSFHSTAPLRCIIQATKQAGERASNPSIVSIDWLIIPSRVPRANQKNVVHSVHSGNCCAAGIGPLAHDNGLTPPYVTTVAQTFRLRFARLASHCSKSELRPQPLGHRHSEASLHSLEMIANLDQRYGIILIMSDALQGLKQREMH
jgi:hypothetical protein